MNEKRHGKQQILWDMFIDVVATVHTKFRKTVVDWYRKHGVMWDGTGAEEPKFSNYKVAENKIR